MPARAVNARWRAGSANPTAYRTLQGHAREDHLPAVPETGLSYLGFLLRSTVGGVATLAGLLLVLPLTVAFLPGSWSAIISPYLPGNAGAAIYAVHPGPAGLGPWAGLAVLCGYAAATLGAEEGRRRILR